MVFWEYKATDNSALQFLRGTPNKNLHLWEKSIDLSFKLLNNLRERLLFRLFQNLLLTSPFILIITVDCLIVNKVSIMSLKNRRKSNASSYITFFYCIHASPVKIHLWSEERNCKNLTLSLYKLFFFFSKLFIEHLM